MKLLFHLPGPKARQFVAESADTLVRFLGGDETLVEEIHQNRTIAQTNVNSVQHFMANHVTTPPPVIHQLDAVRRDTLELDRMERENNKMERENQILALNVLERYRVFAEDHIQDPRRLEHIQNLITNRKYLKAMLIDLILIVVSRCN